MEKIYQLYRDCPFCGAEVTDGVSSSLEEARDYQSRSAEWCCGNRAAQPSYRELDAVAAVAAVGIAADFLTRRATIGDLRRAVGAAYDI